MRAGWSQETPGAGCRQPWTTGPPSGMDVVSVLGVGRTGELGRNPGPRRCGVTSDVCGGGLLGPGRGGNNDTHKGLWRVPQAPVPRGPFIWNLPGHVAGGLEDPVGPVSCLRPLGPPLAAFPPGLGLGVRTQPPLDRALLSANPRLSPARVAGDAEPPPGGLRDVEIDVDPRQGL